MASKETPTQKRQKILKACNDCRRRKLKCDGGEPCSTCQRSSIPCVFESSTPKRGATKHYIKSLEKRIKVIESVLSTFHNPNVNVVRKATLRQQLIEDSQDNTKHYSFSSLESTHSNQFSFQAEEESDLIQFYMNHVHPYFPLFVPSYFHLKLPNILIYAICAVSAHFRNLSEAEFYYQKAIFLFDDTKKPSIHFVQTCLLLIKYMESTIHPSLFFKKANYLLGRAMKVCQVLKLHQVSTDTDWEVRKRVLCMVFTYHTFLSIEQGVEPNHSFLNTVIDQELLLPNILSNETTIECHRYIFMLTCTLSHVHQHLLRVSLKIQDGLEENMALLQLNMTIENVMMHLPPRYQDEGSHVLTRLLHMMYHLNIMILHHYYYMKPLPQESSYNHRQLCLSSATCMIRLVEGTLPLGQYPYVSRGISWVIYCITIALRILDMERKLDIGYIQTYQQCYHLTKCLLASQDNKKRRRI